jgi:hypothetical protein
MRAWLKIPKNRSIAAVTAPTLRNSSGSGCLVTAIIQNFEFEFFLKKPENRSSCHKSNGVKNFQKFVRLVYFTSIKSSTKKEKGKKIGWLNF